MWIPAGGAERWVSVVFLQGADAEQALELIDRSRGASAISHLTHWDFGDETTEAALVNGYVYDGIPTCPTDRVDRGPRVGIRAQVQPDAWVTSACCGAISGMPIEHRSVDVGSRPRRHRARRRFVPAWFSSPRPGHEGHCAERRTVTGDEQLHATTLINPRGEHRRDRRGRERAVARLQADARRARCARGEEPIGRGTGRGASIRVPARRRRARSRRLAYARSAAPAQASGHLRHAGGALPIPRRSGPGLGRASSSDKTSTPEARSSTTRGCSTSVG